MAYKVLYRKYRPQNFNDLYGQENIKKILIESIINDKLAHAYLFSGPRGTGKTSTAKLFAKTINCQNPIDGIPCNECNSCINYEKNPDIIEIDAASNNGVDEIRNLRDNAKILPTMSKFKVYIIDEVHMLSQGAWNAFLKILEEPPHHVIFILATTEIQKIPITILSRCQRYSFTRINEETIKENILRIAKEEKIKLTEDAATLIATLADGGMRDALSILDQLSKENIPIDRELITKTYGLISENDIDDIFSNIRDGNISEIDKILTNYYQKGLEVNQLISKLIEHIYSLEIAVIKGKESFFCIEDLKKMSSELIQFYNKKDAITLIKMSLISFISQESILKKQEKIISREIILDKNTPDSKKPEISNEPEQEKDTNPDIIEKIKKIRINNSFVNASKTYKTKFKKSWEIFINTEKENINSDILSLIEDVSIEVVSPTNVLFSHKSKSTSVLFNKSVNKIEEEFNKNNDTVIRMICLTIDEWEKEKKIFISNKEKQYSYVQEPKIDEDNTILNEAMDVFSDTLIEIK